MNEEQLLQYFYDIDFEKKLKKTASKFKNKKIIIYGCGLMFDLIHKYFDLSELDIIGVYDGKFKDLEQKEYKSFSIIKPENFNKADIILISTWNTIDIAESLKPHKVKTYPLVQKKFKDIMKEIWG